MFNFREEIKSIKFDRERECKIEKFTENFLRNLVEKLKEREDLLEIYTLVFDRADTFINVYLYDQPSVSLCNEVYETKSLANDVFIRIENQLKSEGIDVKTENDESFTIKLEA